MAYVEAEFDAPFLARLHALRGPGDLVEMSAVVAAADGHLLDVGTTVQTLDELAANMRELELDSLGSADRARALSEAFVRRLGFNGCESDYYNPRNSYLDQVVVRREGIPVTLAIVYLELGRRLDLRLVGVNFPGHFLVALLEGATNEGVLIDPFGNIVLSQDECALRLKRQFGEHAKLQPEHFVRATRQGIAVRMLGNLKAIRVNAGDFAAAVRLCSAALEVMPDHPGELSDRARLLEQMGRFEDAIDDLQRLQSLLLAESGSDGSEETSSQREKDRRAALDVIRERIEELRQQGRPIVH